MLFQVIDDDASTDWAEDAVLEAPPDAGAGGASWEGAGVSVVTEPAARPPPATHALSTVLKAGECIRPSI